MDREQHPKPPQVPVLRAQDVSRVSPVQEIEERAEESPVSIYTTPTGSPAGRDSPRKLANNPHPLSPRSPRPSRPPRPAEVMPLQAAKARNYLPMRTPPKSNEELAQYWEGANRPTPRAMHGQNSDGGSSEDLTTSASTSSMPSLPTSPSATPPSGAARKAQLVPPSSARRGASSLYSQGTSFSPILEESPDPASRKRASIASSRVVPSSWGSHPDDYNFDRIKEQIEGEEEIRKSPASPDSTASMHDDTTGLVRQASMGKKMKASLTKIRNSGDHPPTTKSRETIGLGTITAGVAAGSLGSSRGKDFSPAASSAASKETTGNRTIIIDSSPSSSRASSQESGKGLQTLQQPITRSRSPLASAADRSARQPASQLGGVNRPVSKGPSVSDKVPSNRRPPHLDMEAVKDSESRASITSLPDLIRRATRLAANLDRGRSASRTGQLDMMNVEKNEQRRRSGSISDILASFPPPSHGTPDGTRPESRWPSPFSASRLNQRMSYITSHDSSSTRLPRNDRRCCGMSLCAFLIIMLLLAILIAAAIVVPIVLIVLPRQRQAAANATGPSTLDHCSDSTPCQNGGVSVVSGDTCRCVCVNGFTGDRCQTPAGPGCTTTDIGSGAIQFPNATVGDAIPRLLSGAGTNYSIQLNGTAILSLFSTNNLSCASENALVNIDGQSMKARDLSQKPAGGDMLPPHHPYSAPLPTPTPDADPSLRFEPRQVGTSNGIVFQVSSTASGGPPSSPNSASKTSISASSSSTSSPQSSGKTGSQETVDFARIAVLFVLEQTGQLNTAVQAQDNIRDFLLNRSNRTDAIPLGAHGVDLSLNFASFSIVLGNGTEIGGKGDGNGRIKDRKTKRSKQLLEPDF
jgi:hypothetical protein